MNSKPRIYIRAKPSENCYFKTTSTIITLPYNNRETSYEFDRVFMPGTSLDIFMTTVMPLIDNCLLGYNCTLLAHGPSGSGKTYTLDNLLKDTVHALLIKVDVFELSVIEIYNEVARDILNDKLVVKEIRKSSCVKIASKDDFNAVLQQVEDTRQFSSTFLNQSSSRSHVLYSFNIVKKSITCRLILGDLAGSENTKKAGTLQDEKRLKESKHINKSLLEIGNVIQALSNNSSYISYRNSTLTNILKHNLTKRAHISLILCISPELKDFSNTKSTLSFGCIASKIVCKPVVTSNKKKTTSFGVQTDSDSCSCLSDSPKSLSYTKSSVFTFEQDTDFCDDLLIDIPDTLVFGEDSIKHENVREGLLQELSYIFDNYSICICMNNQHYTPKTDLYSELIKIYNCQEKHIKRPRSISWFNKWFVM